MMFSLTNHRSNEAESPSHSWHLVQMPWHVLGGSCERSAARGPQPGAHSRDTSRGFTKRRKEGSGRRLRPDSHPCPEILIRLSQAAPGTDTSISNGQPWSATTHMATLLIYRREVWHLPWRSDGTEVKKTASGRAHTGPHFPDSQTNRFVPQSSSPHACTRVHTHHTHVHTYTHTHTHQ